jgi:hypothetical protein
MAVHVVLHDLNKYHKDVDVDHTHRMLDLTKLLWPDNESRAVSMAMSNFYKDVDVDHAKRMLELTRLFHPDKESMAVQAAMWNKYKNVDVDQTKRMLELTKILIPESTYLALNEAMKPKYKPVDVNNVYETYQTLKKSPSWFDSWNSTSDKNYMKRALRLTYPKIVKEDF